MEPEELSAFSREIGVDASFVLAGGGNTSAKVENIMYVKASGTCLSTIEPDQFVKMNRDKLNMMWSKQYSDSDDEREAEVLSDLLSARCEGEESKRPSVETLLHSLFPQKYVLHVHPAMVNGLTCAKDGEKYVKEMFPKAIWINEIKPGYWLASEFRKRISEERERGNIVNLVFMQNHGICFAGDDYEDIKKMIPAVLRVIAEKVEKKPDMTEVQVDNEKKNIVANKIRDIFEHIDKKNSYILKAFNNKSLTSFMQDKDKFNLLSKPLTPDHIVYCKAVVLYFEIFKKSIAKKQIVNYYNTNGYLPKVINIKDIGTFVIGKSEKDVDTAIQLWKDAVKVVTYTENFGGVRPMSDEMIHFIVNWEAENYRSKIGNK